MKTNSVSFMLAALCSLVSAAQLCAQSTTFTYQGRLIENGSPVDGLHDLTFTLFVANDDTRFAGPLTNSAVSISNGLFTALLDFGPGIFDTRADLFLEVAVRPTGSGAFTTLSPRQRVTSTPYAIRAGTASDLASGAVNSLNNLHGNLRLAAGANVTINESNSVLTIASPSGGSGPWRFQDTNIFFLDGNVAIGATSPDRPLAISGIGPAQEWLSFRVGGATRWHINSRNQGWNLAETGVADGRLFVAPGGNVGVGTDQPTAALDVRGEIRMGPAGLFRAAAGDENLRIIRGSIGPIGSILSGSGFTVIQAGVGDYTIRFLRPFAGAPTITAAAEFELGANNPSRTATPDNISATGASVVIAVVSGNTTTLVSSGFHFIAVGPR